MTANPQSPVPPAPISDETVVELAKTLFEHFEGQISMADQKAQLTLAADTLLAAAITTLGSGEFFSRGATTLEFAQGMLSLLTLAALLVSIYFALLVARPVLKINKHQRQSLFYFGHIAVRSEADFIAAFMAQPQQEIEETLLAQVYAKAVIAQRKFKGIRRSLDFLLVALVVWAVAQILSLFAG